MKTYYINNGNENGGPFTIEELKSQHISTATLVWCNGMDEWKYAADIEELQPLFRTLPPPVKQSQKPESTIITEPKTILGLKISHFILTIIFLAIMIFILILNLIQANKKSLLDERNRQTELGNEKVKLDQKVDSEQRIQEEIQKKITTANNNTFKKDSITNRIAELKVLIRDSKSKLDTAESDLIAAQKFKLLRSEENKNEQISSFQNTIMDLKKEINKHESDLNRLYLQLETIH